MSIRSLLFLASFFAACGFSLRFPLVGVINCMSLYLFAPNSNWWIRTIRHLDIRYSFLAILFLGLGMVLNWHRLSRRVKGLSGLEWAFVAFLAVVWLSAYVGVGLTETGEALVEKVTKLVVFLFLLTHSVTTLRDYRAVRWLWVLGGAYLGYRCLTEISSGRVSGIGGPDFKGSSGMSAHLAFTLVFVGVTFLLDQRWRSRAISLISGGLLVNGLVLMRTRGSFLGLAVGALAAVVLMPRIHRKKIIVAMLLGGIAAYGLTDQSYWERMGTISSSDEEMDRSSSVRTDLWRNSLDILGDHPLGVGIGNFPEVIGDYEPALRGRASHNTFVRIYVDLGVQGIAVYLLVLFLVARSLSRTRNLALDNPQLEGVEIEATGLGVAIIIALVAGFFTERSFVEGYWWLFAMTVCLERAAVNALQSPDEQPRDGARIAERSKLARASLLQEK